MKEKIIFLAIALVMLVVIIGSSYAFLSTQSESSKNHIVKAGKLEISFSDANDSKINLEGAYPIPDSEGMKGMPHTFTITNTGSLPASYQISLADNTTLYNSHNDAGKIFEENQLKLGITNGNGNTTYQLYKKGTFIEGTLDSGKSATYTIRMWIPEHIGNEVQGYHFHGNIKVDSIQTLGTKNQNITKIYAYNQETGSSTFCVTGEEDTCQEIKNAPATYDEGTIIKYKVNDTLEKFFHVMYDNGDTLTLQQRENTVESIAYYETENNDNTKGPVTILPALENATLEWSNVNDLSYALGTTIFKDNAYTGCGGGDLICNTNHYSMSTRTAKARMITFQETRDFGCTYNQQSCPIWMYNYLSQSNNYGGTELGNNNGYWLSSVNSFTVKLEYGWFLYTTGSLSGHYTLAKDTGARAVIEINKLDKEAVQTIPRNENIVAIFKYNQNSDSTSFCVTGEEASCEQILETPKTYESGTIIKYKVNDSEEKYFHVVSDNGTTLTMQQRENIANATSWYSTTADNTKGPTTVLPILEDATSGWTNVLDQTYTLGTTIFKENSFTGCGYDDATAKFSCISNAYTLPQRTAKARLITIQEVSSFGCTYINKSCPLWLYNYLSKSIDYGATDIGVDEGYWTATSNLINEQSVWLVNAYGHATYSHSTATHHGVRAVVMIQK